MKRKGCLSILCGFFLFSLGGMLITCLLFPAKEISFSFAAMGIIPEGISKFFLDSGALYLLMFSVVLWAVILFLLRGAGIVIAIVTLGVFALVIYSFAGLVVFGVLDKETFLWVSFASLAIPLFPFFLMGLMRRGGGDGGGSSREEKTIEHYDDWGKYTGESKVRGSTIEHYDGWGKRTGESKVQGKTIELYDSRGNRIGESKVQGNTIEHRDEQGKGKGESKIK